MLIYTFNLHDKLLIILLSIVVVGTFLYSLLSVWTLSDSRNRRKILPYIFLFAIIFHSTTGLINYYFQGVIATGYGLLLLVVFWKMLTRKS